MIAGKTGIVSVVFLLLLYGSTAGAQDSTATWTLQDCLDYAIQNNITINTLRLTQRSTQQDLLQARAAVQPSLAATATQNLSHQKSYNYDTLGVTGRSSLSFTGNYGANASMILYNGGYIRNDIRFQGLSLQAAGLNIQAEINSITLEVTQDYLNILLARENIIYLQDLYNTSAAQVTQGQQRYDAGVIALKDLAELQAQQANDKYTLVNAQNAHRQYIVTLKQLLQLPSDTGFAIREPDTLFTSRDVLPLRDVQQTALANRPEIKASELNVDLNKVGLDLARAAGLPVLTANGSISTTAATGQSFTYLKQLDNNFYQQIGLTLSVPIFNKRVVKTGVEKAKINIEQSQLDLKNARTTLSYNIEQAYINVQNAQGQYEAAVEQLKYTQESYRIASEQLRVGVANTVEFLQQKNLYVNALQSYIQAKYNAALTIRIYDFYRGVPVKL